jgi:hypothetical protein
VTRQRNVKNRPSRGPATRRYRVFGANVGHA